MFGRLSGDERTPVREGGADAAATPPSWLLANKAGFTPEATRWDGVESDWTPCPAGMHSQHASRGRQSGKRGQPSSGFRMLEPYTCETHRSKSFNIGRPTRLVLRIICLQTRTTDATPACAWSVLPTAMPSFITHKIQSTLTRTVYRSIFRLPTLEFLLSDGLLRCVSARQQLGLFARLAEPLEPFARPRRCYLVFVFARLVTRLGRCWRQVS
jgi:hypothetical protein